VRRDIGLMGQGSGLFHGTIRENLMLGAPLATDDVIDNGQIVLDEQKDIALAKLSGKIQ